MRYVFWLLLGMLAWGQDIQGIVDRNPFDPDRGKKDVEGKEPELDETPDISAREMPILDGTMILGETRIAIFSLTHEGQPITARVEMKGNSGNYNLYLREKKKPAPKPGRRNRAGRGKENRKPRTLPNKMRKPLNLEPKGEEEKEKKLKTFADPIPNGKIAGYTVTEIDRDYVQLSGDGAPVRVEMYAEGVEKTRGGSKVIPKPKTPKKGRKPIFNNKPKDTKKKSSRKKPVSSQNTSKQKTRKQNRVKQDFTRRELPSAKGSKKKKGRVTKEDLKEKF